MDYITPDSTQGKILCCECGILIDPNPTNQCIACVRARNDITEGVPKQVTIFFCKGCERYLDPPATWVVAALESKELLRFCLKKLKGLNSVRLVDAGFVWTEPHSKRIKVKLSVQKEIQAGAVLQQEFVVEYTVNSQMCSDCHRVEAKDYWRALVQVRQRTDNKRTFYYLEQLILKHRAHEQTLGIKTVDGGIDFFYANDQAARRLIEFLVSVVPCRWSNAKKLVSQDVHSNICDFKNSFCVEIVPLSKDSVVCLPAKLAHQLGGISQICVIRRVTSMISVIDPNTAQIADISSTLYWKTPFLPLCTSKHLTEFYVIDNEEANVRHFTGQGHLSCKHRVGEVWLQRASDIGTDNAIFCRTHLGHLLNPGDFALGFDLRNANTNDSNLDKLKTSDIPDVVLVKKVFADRSTRNRKRKWRLRHLGIDDDTGSQNRDYTDFLEDLEEDEQFRTNVNIYKDKEKMASLLEESDVEDIPTIGMEEMLEDLVISDDPAEAEASGTC